MTTLTIASLLGTGLISVIAWFKWQAHKAMQQAVKLQEKNTKLEAEKQSITAIVKTQEKVIKSAKIKQKNEENIRRISSNGVDDRLQQHSWFRDENQHRDNGV